MKVDDLIFDQEMEMLLHIPEEEHQVYLSVSDDLRMSLWDWTIRKRF